METVGIVGLGTMGAGIAQVCITAGVRGDAPPPPQAPFPRGRRGVQEPPAPSGPKGGAAPQRPAPAPRPPPGSPVNGIVTPTMSGAVRVLDEGVASPQDVDKAMALGANWPIGPLALCDLIGLDVHLHAAEALWRAFREPRFAPPPRLVRLVQA